MPATAPAFFDISTLPGDYCFLGSGDRSAGALTANPTVAEQAGATVHFDEAEGEHFA